MFPVSLKSNLAPSEDDLLYNPYFTTAHQLITYIVSIYQTVHNTFSEKQACKLEIENDHLERAVTELRQRLTFQEDDQLDGNLTKVSNDQGLIE